MSKSIVRSMSTEGDGSANIEICIDTWPPQTIIQWNWIVAVDVDSRASRTEIYFKRGREKYYLNKERQADENRTVSAAPRTRVPGDFQVCANFVGSSSGDSLRLYAFGEVVEK